MKTKKHNNHSFFIIVGIVAILVACKSSQVPLSKEELDFSNSLAQKYQCEVSMQHDYNAIKTNKQDGAFWIQLKNTENDLCSKDSPYLKEVAKEIATQLFGIISHKENYASINVAFNTTKENNQINNTTCDKELELKIKDLKTVRFIHYWIK